MDTGKLVAEIEKRPVLYDTRIAHSSSKELKPRMWLEVAANTVPGWEALSHDQRQKIGIHHHPLIQFSSSLFYFFLPSFVPQPSSHARGNSIPPSNLKYFFTYSTLT
jgi:hypothetical protein